MAQPVQFQGASALCSVCGQRPPGKLATIYWRWATSTSEWDRYKQRYCARCLGDVVVPMLAEARQLKGRECQVGDGHHAHWTALTYYTLYTPRVKEGPTMEGAVCHCGDHLEQARAAMTRNAEDLAGVGNGAPRTRPQEDPWEGLELP